MSYASSARPSDHARRAADSIENAGTSTIVIAAGIAIIYSRNMYSVIVDTAYLGSHTSGSGRLLIWPCVDKKRIQCVDQPDTEH